MIWRSARVAVVGALQEEAEEEVEVEVSGRALHLELSSS
jgi:hypothetical protein